MRIKNIVDRIRRVFSISSKPTKTEFWQSSKITGIGMVVIGVAGFVIFLIATLLGGKV